MRNIYCTFYIYLVRTLKSPNNRAGWKEPASLCNKFNKQIRWNLCFLWKNLQVGWGEKSLKNISEHARLLGT